MNQNIFGSITVTTINPVSFTHHGQEGLPMMTRGVDGEGRHLKTVFLPAAGLRGRIRHEVAMSVLEREGKVKLARAYMLALGQSTEGREGDEGDVQYRIAEQLALREKDPVVDLFGTWKISSRLQVSHLMPAANVQPDRFSYIRRDLDSNEAMFALFDSAEQDAFYDRQQAMSQASKAGDMIKAATAALMKAKKAKASVDDIEKLETKIAELKALQAAHKGDVGGDGNNSKHLLEVEAIPAGVDLLGTLIVQRARARDLEMLVESFDRISRRPIIGAHTARGCGQVAGKATFSSDDGEVLVVVEFGGFRKAKVEWTDAGKHFVSIQQAA
jgi:hypothetical protein